ncbi:MAG: hypothetical protein WC547_00875 [Candidatus Omnitrophota bacterium]
MNKFTIGILVSVGLMVGMCAPCFASDWDKAGKVFAVTEGLRIVTGGAVDVLGSITGINRNRGQVREVACVRKNDPPRYYARRVCRPEPCRVERVWVPNLVWREKFVPEHSEYRPGYGNIWIGAHYEKYQVEEGGHWEINEVMCCVRR